MTDAIVNKRALVGDLTLHYLQAGASEEVIVLLHGFPQQWVRPASPTCIGSI